MPQINKITKEFNNTQIQKKIKEYNKLNTKKKDFEIPPRKKDINTKNSTTTSKS